MLPSELEMKSKYPWVMWDGISQPLLIISEASKLNFALAYNIKVKV